VLVAAVVAAPPMAFFVLAAGAAALAVLEVCALAERQGIQPLRGVAVLGALVILASFLSGGPPLLPALALCTAGVPLAVLAARRPMAQALPVIAVTLFGAVFVGLLLGYQVGLRGVPDEGPDLLLFLWWVVWASDTASYLAGTRLGRRPLAPALSPRKTLEGTAAGLATAIVAGILGRAWFLENLTPWHAGALGLALGVMGLVGDLCESLLKRGAQVKDSSTLFPGHGGMLDRTDSLLLSAPVLYHCWAWLSA
jgi:phosphatidate cytidylyltransferase